MFDPMSEAPAPPTPAAPTRPATPQTLDDARRAAEAVRARIRYDVMGRDDVIELVLVALFVYPPDFLKRSRW